MTDLKTMRKVCGLTQSEAGRICNPPVSASYVEKLENSRKPVPELKSAKALAYISRIKKMYDARK